MATELTQKLTLPATQLVIPDEPSMAQLAGLADSVVSEDAWSMGTHALVYAHVLRLAIASVLETQVLHIGAHRYRNFDLSGDPAEVTLSQISALFRPHNGTGGQAFELAVADAVNAGIPEVIGPVRQALRMLNIPEEGRIGMVCLGLEKVPSGARADFWAGVRALIDDTAVLRNGRRGRPAKLSTVIARLSQSKWSEMGGLVKTDGTVEEQAQVSQLGRADALLFGDGWITPVSLKINSRHISLPWRDVPLWITTTKEDISSVEARNNGSPRASPQIVISLSVSGWVGLFHTAVEIVLTASRRIDRNEHERRYQGPAGTPMHREMFRAAVRRLWKRRGDSVSAICASLRDIDPTITEMFGAGVASFVTTADVPIADTWMGDSIWTPSGPGAQLVVGQRHLFVPASGGEFVARVI